MERAQQLRMRGWAAADLRAQAITHAARLSGVMTLEQARELSGLMLASHRTLQRGLRMVALTIDDQAKIEDLIPTTPDNELVKLYRELPLQLAAADEVLSEAVAQIDDRSAVVDRAGEEVREYIARSTDRHQYAAEPARRSRTVRPGTSAHRPTAGPVVTFPVDHPPDRARPYDQAFAAARVGLDGAWKRGDLERALSVSKTQALTYIQAWLVSGDIIRLDEPRDHYVFTEER